MGPTVTVPLLTRLHRILLSSFREAIRPRAGTAPLLRRRRPTLPAGLSLALLASWRSSLRSGVSQAVRVEPPRSVARTRRERSRCVLVLLASRRTDGKHVQPDEQKSERSFGFADRRRTLMNGL